MRFEDFLRVDDVDVDERPSEREVPLDERHDLLGRVRVVCQPDVHLQLPRCGVAVARLHGGDGGGHGRERAVLAEAR